MYVTHKVLPLDHAHFGRLPAQTIRSAEAFHARALRFADDLHDAVRAVVPFAPDSNLVCFALNPVGNRRVAAANAFVRAPARRAAQRSAASRCRTSSSSVR